MSDLEQLAGRSYGPVTFRVSEAQVAAYVAATGDDPHRWSNCAPPSFAAAVLFKVAPAFFADPDMAAHIRLMIHGEQAFSWKAPWRIGSHLSVEGRITRLRQRGATSFVTFGVEVKDDHDRSVLSSRSLFLMSDSQPPGGGFSEREEPQPDARRQNASPAACELPVPGIALPALAKSASRSDLVRYAAASEDFNPVHWDHGRAVDSGVGGVICHGLLMAAWAMQPVTATIDRPDPLVKGRFRFRHPLHPALAARVETTVKSRTERRATVRASVISDAGSHVVASIEARTRRASESR